MSNEVDKKLGHYCTILYFTVPIFCVLEYTGLYSTSMYHTSLYCTALYLQYYIVQYCLVLYCRLYCKNPRQWLSFKGISCRAAPHPGVIRTSAYSNGNTSTILYFRLPSCSLVINCWRLYFSQIYKTSIFILLFLLCYTLSVSIMY